MPAAGGRRGPARADRVRRKRETSRGRDCPPPLPRHRGTEFRNRVAREIIYRPRDAHTRSRRQRWDAIVRVQQPGHRFSRVFVFFFFFFYFVTTNSRGGEGDLLCNIINGRGYPRRKTSHGAFLFVFALLFYFFIKTTTAIVVRT